MKSHVLILILTTIALSGCSSVPVSSVNSTVESPAGTKKRVKGYLGIKHILSFVGQKPSLIDICYRPNSLLFGHIILSYVM
jgi:uncharacterized protein YceK